MASLFRRKNKGQQSPVSSSSVSTKKITNSELTEVIERLQKNADQVEKYILDTETKLQSDIKQVEKRKPFEYREITSDNLKRSQDVLTRLDGDVESAWRLNHPQADMIKEDIKQLKERVRKLREEHERVYNLKPGETVIPTINWGKVMDEKQMKLNSMTFGNDLPSVNEQVEEHNLFHKEVEAMGPHINKNADKDYISGLQVKYNKLLSASDQRQHDLNSLRDYMQRCTNELYWMDQQEHERMTYDWSDKNLNYNNRQRQYENFINKNLEAKETTVTKLHEDGEKMVAANHPGKNAIEAHMEAVHADWKEYLNLLICEESHLKNMKDYHKFHKDAKEAQDLLKKVDTDLNQKYSPEFKDIYQTEFLLRDLDDQEKTMDKFGDVVSSLQKRSQQVLPLKYRRETPLKPIPVEALCDYFSEEGQINRGDRYTLRKKDTVNWEVTDSSGRKQVAPGMCFMIPPTDSEAIALADSINNQYKGVKQKLASNKNALLRRYEDLKKENSSSPGDAQELQCRQLLSGLDKINNDLDKQEKSATACLRPPLEQSRPIQDSSDRMQELKNIANNVRRIEPDKTMKIRECEAFLATSPKCASAPQLQNKVNDTNKKYERVNNLLNSAQEKIDNTNRLENSLQKGRDMLSGYENKLAFDETVPESMLGVDNKLQELAALNSELKSKRPIINEAEQNLKNAKKSSDILASKYQEHCPDIDREEAEVRKLNQRYDNLSKQIDTRAQHLQKAKTAYNSYNKGYNDMNKWLDTVPNNEPKATDSLQQIDTKLKNQRRLLTDISNKEPEMEKVSSSAQQYQQAVKDYEIETEKMRSVLDLENGLEPHTYKKHKPQSPANKIKEEEAVLSTKFTEVNAVNKQRLQNLEFAQNLLQQKPEVELMQEQRAFTSRAEKPGEDPWMIKRMLDEEIQRRQQLEMEIKSTQNEILVLETQKPQQLVTTKESIKKLSDPQLEEEYSKYQQRVAAEQLQNKALQNELEALQLKLRSLENEKVQGAQQFMVKEVLRIEKDRVQEDEVLRLKEELERLKRQKTSYENDLTLIRKRITILTEEKSREQEKITEQEVVKVQNDPQLESEFKMLQENRDRENKLRLQLEEEIHILEEKLRRLEKEKAMAEEKITVKEVLKVEKDIAVERDAIDLRRQYESEVANIQSMQREKTDLQRKIQLLEEEKAKPIVQEKKREIFRPDPKTESEVTSLRMTLLEQERRYRDSEQQLKVLQDEVTALRNRGPQVEVKELIKEVIKYKTDPETERLLGRLREEIVDKTHEIEKSEREITQLKQEIETLRNTKPQVQVKEVVNEVLQYREDPKTKEEVERLKAQLAEEQKKYLVLQREKSENDERIRLREMELSQVKEKLVQQEVVKLEEDPVVKAECDSISKNINNELKQMDALREELRKLQRRKSELERQLEDLQKEKQSRRDTEFEIQKLRIRLTELEEKEKLAKEKVTVKQTVVLQQDPQQEKEHGILKLQLEEEMHKRQMVENELKALQEKLYILEQKEVKERVVFSEKVQVERDPESEAQIQILKNSIEDEVRRKRELNEEISRLNAKLSEAEFTNTKSSKELEHLKEEMSKLQMENNSFQSQIRKLQLNIDITAKETKDIKGVSELDNLVNFESRIVSLQRELTDLKHISKEKDREIEQLQKRLGGIKTKREQRENHLRRSIVVIDPDTGREMSPEEAHRLGLIDWNMFVNLQSQECDWEEITIKEGDGESSVLHDRISGNKFSISDALKLGRISQAQLNRYINKDMSIQEFALLVSGKK